MNAVFGYSVDISVNETMIAGIATGTAIFLVPLPHPIALQFPKTYHETVPADRQNTRDHMEKLSQKNVLTSTILFNYKRLQKLLFWRQKPWLYFIKCEKWQTIAQNLVRFPRRTQINEKHLLTSVIAKFLLTLFLLLLLLWIKSGMVRKHLHRVLESRHLKVLLWPP